MYECYAAAWHNGAIWCLDTLFIPFGLIVGLTGYRVKRLIRRAKV